VSLFECGHLVDTKEERHPLLDAGMKSGREFFAALNGDRGLYGRNWNKVDFVFFYDSPTIDFQLGTAYAALGERVSEPFENAKSIDQLRAPRARAFAELRPDSQVGLLRDKLVSRTISRTDFLPRKPCYRSLSAYALPLRMGLSK
jgi:hypothetical protein